MAVTPEQTIATLRRRAEHARVAREAAAADTRTRLQRCMAGVLADGTRAWLIGSLAWGDFGDRSDVDVVLRGATPEQATQLEVELTQALHLPVDMLRFEELPASFRERIEQQGIVLHG